MSGQEPPHVTICQKVQNTSNADTSSSAAQGLDSNMGAPSNTPGGKSRQGPLSLSEHHTSHGSAAPLPAQQQTVIADTKQRSDPVSDPDLDHASEQLARQLHAEELAGIQGRPLLQKSLETAQKGGGVSSLRGGVGKSDKDSGAGYKGNKARLGRDAVTARGTGSQRTLDAFVTRK